MFSTTRFRFVAGAALAGGVVFMVGCARPSDRSVESRAGSETSSAPSGKAVANRGNALVRFANALPGRPGVDLSFGELHAFMNVAYKSVTPYQELPAERRDFRLTPPESSANTLVTNSEGLSQGRRYTVIALQRDDGSPALIVVADDAPTPPEGKAKVRVIHAAANTGEVDLVPTGRTDPLFDGVNFNSATGYREVDPSAKGLEVRKEGDNRVIMRIPDMDLAPGRLYTVIVAGNGEKLDTISVEDRVI